MSRRSNGRPTPSRGVRTQRRTEERAGRRRAAVPQPENPTPLLMRHLPCLVDPACPVDHLHRKRKEVRAVDDPISIAFKARHDQKQAAMTGVFIDLAAKYDGVDTTQAEAQMMLELLTFDIGKLGLVTAIAHLALTLHRERQAGGLGGPS